MKIFREQNDSWSDKVNFVDSNNVLVGYDMGQSCCEHADWFISTDKKKNVIDGNGITEGLEDYNFDPKYFVYVELDKDGYGYNCLDKGGMVCFRLVSDGNPDLFLHIYNSHNGYYGHGFEAKINGIAWQEGTL